MHLLLEQARFIRGVVRARKVSRDIAQSARVCELDTVSNIVDLKRVGAFTARSRRRSCNTTPHSYFFFNVFLMTIYANEMDA